MKSLERQSPILVTGIIRGGTTFVGKMLSVGPEIGYIHEPFNPDHGLDAVDRWFLYLKEGLPEESTYSSSIKQLLSGRGVYKYAPERDRTMLRTVLRSIFRSKENIEYVLATRDPRVRRYLIKDPIACLSSEYLHREFAMKVVIIVRHPAAFVCSHRRMNWRFHFSHFINQKTLMEDHLSPVLEGHDLSALSRIEEAALLWNCIYATLTTFKHRNPQMIIVRHEDLSQNPEIEFRRLFESLGLTYSERCRRKIEAYTRASNPTAPVEGQLHTLKRDSRSNTKLWKGMLEPEEIETVRSLTCNISKLYYKNSDW